MCTRRIHALVRGLTPPSAVNNASDVTFLRQRRVIARKDSTLCSINVDFYSISSLLVHLAKSELDSNLILRSFVLPGQAGSLIAGPLVYRDSETVETSRTVILIKLVGYGRPPSVDMMLTPWRYRSNNFKFTESVCWDSLPTAATLLVAVKAHRHLIPKPLLSLFVTSLFDDTSQNFFIYYKPMAKKLPCEMTHIIGVATPAFHPYIGNMYGVNGDTEGQQPQQNCEAHRGVRTFKGRVVPPKALTRKRSRDTVTEAVM
ncbi:hypothetical protein EVAR_29094_1 [Eumeta japonica]|uniref:Uncharacterized protein n=1 Tax=Eumeta variegata TaxID=151549 RepID=A0A4C1VPR1_EUMVA|nr:hypothetical protein EVAR_29094_1 [Eumeta japonica]